MKILHLQVKGRILSKKNQYRITGNRLMSSVKYQEWHTQASLQLLKYKNTGIEKAEIQMEFFWPDNRNSDLTNKAESINDLLVDLNIIKDDNWKVLDSVYLRSAGVDKKNPRVDIWIKERD